MGGLSGHWSAGSCVCKSEATGAESEAVRYVEQIVADEINLHLATSRRERVLSEHEGRRPVSLGIKPGISANRSPCVGWCPTLQIGQEASVKLSNVACDVRACSGVVCLAAP